MPSPTLLTLALALFVLLLVPTRRLMRAGWPPRALGTYLGGMLLLGLVVAELPGPARYLVPILVVGYLAPFVTVRDGLDRLRGRRGSPVPDGRDGTTPEVRVERPPVKQVSGPARDVRPAGTTDPTGTADPADPTEDASGRT